MPLHIHDCMTTFVVIAWQCMRSSVLVLAHTKLQLINSLYIADYVKASLKTQEIRRYNFWLVLIRT